MTNKIELSMTNLETTYRNIGKAMDELRKLKEQASNDFLRFNHLDGDVVRVRDNKRGRIVYDNYDRRLKFYLYTAKGTLSKRCDEWVYEKVILQKFKPCGG